MLNIFIADGTDNEFFTSLFEQVPHIENLYLNGNFTSYFNLDHLYNLKYLSLEGTIDENFNSELFRNLCQQLEILDISFDYVDEEAFLSLFDGCIFPYLTSLSVRKIDLLKINFFQSKSISFSQSYIFIYELLLH